MRRRNAIVAGLASLLALAVLTGPGSAQAKPPKSFYGVVPQTQISASDLTRMGQGRIGTVRIPIVWSVIDPSALPLDYQWEQLDKLIGGAASSSIQALPVITSTPTWVSQLDNCPGNCLKQPPQGDLAMLAWRTFIRDLVRRYGREGTYWTEHPEVQKIPITAWQIWNEQNSAQYFAPQPNSDVYARLVTEASRAIELEDPNADVILGGMFATPQGKNNPETNSWTYLRRLYAIPGFAGRFDGVAVHPYAQGMKGVRLQVKLLREEMERAGDGGTGLWVTEIGWGAAPKNPDQVLLRGPKGQAKKLRQAFSYFTEKRRRLNIKVVNWFAWKDSGPELVLCAWCPSAGLFSNFLEPKPSWSAFVKFTGGS